MSSADKGESPRIRTPREAAVEKVTSIATEPYTIQKGFIAVAMIAGAIVASGMAGAELKTDEGIVSVYEVMLVGTAATAIGMRLSAKHKVQSEISNLRLLTTSTVHENSVPANQPSLAKQAVSSVFATFNETFIRTAQPLVSATGASMSAGFGASLHQIATETIFITPGDYIATAAAGAITAATFVAQDYFARHDVKQAQARVEAVSPNPGLL